MPEAEEVFSKAEELFSEAAVSLLMLSASETVGFGLSVSLDSFTAAGLMVGVLVSAGILYPQTRLLISLASSSPHTLHTRFSEPFFPTAGFSVTSHSPQS